MLVGSKLVSFYVCLHSFKCTPTRIADLVRYVSDQKIYWYRTFTLSAGMILRLSTWFVFSQLYSYSIYHFEIDIYWYRTFYFSAGIIFLLSTWFVLCSVSYTATLFIPLKLIFINIEHSLCLPVWFCFYQLGLCCVQSVIQLPYLSLCY